MSERWMIAAGVAGALLMGACASIGTPSGGPRDEDPPRFLNANPPMGAVEVTPSRVTLNFDELVALKDAFSKVVVSPPSDQMPRVSSLGRRVTVEFRDSLLPETTYTIDFGDAIADNNEGNRLENFIYTFSTGPVLDTLMVSGMVLGAEDLQPAAGMYVGLHSNLADSAFRTRRFERVAKTDDNGRFVIGGLAPGRYRIYALDDRDNDMAWSSPDETLAFYETVLEPYAEQTVATDTIFNLFTGAVDSTMQRVRTRFLPNNILLRPYNTGYAQQYITEYQRVDSTRLKFTFNAHADSMPEITIVGAEDDMIPPVVERSLTNDTLTLWLRDRRVIERDTLRVALRYFRADSAYNMVPVNDTLRMLTQRPNVKASKVTKKEEATDSLTAPEPPPVIEIASIVSRPEIYQPLILELPSPPEEFDLSMITLEWKDDTVWTSLPDFDPSAITFDTLNPRRFRVVYPWKYETAYQLRIDSLAARDIYGLYTDDLKLEFTTRAESDYGSLRFNLSNFGTDTVPRFVQLLDASGKPLRTLPLETGSSVTFLHLLPGKYNARVVEDRNGNLQWDPGDFDTGLLPDVAYYYKETVELKANWDQEIDWNVFATPVDLQLPEALRKKKNR